MYWETLLKEVLQQKNTPQVPEEFCDESPIDISKARTEYKKFFLGDSCGNVYFTSREAEVMVQLIHGKTLHAAAATLKLSPRTIEFYVKNMKTKLACRTKSELIGKVFASDFVRSIELIVSPVE